MPKFNIADLKKASALSQSKIADSADKKRSYVDERVWKPEYDKGGNANAIIRLLPSLNPDKLPWVQTEKYFLKGPAGWYIQNSRRMIGEKDPMGDWVHEQYVAAPTDEAKKELLGKFRSQKKYLVNALVVKDPLHPENEGRVVLYEYGKQIQDKIIEKLKPTFEGDEAINVFDWFNGANLRLKIYKEGPFPKFDRCDFSNSGPVGTDEQIEDIAEKMHDLSEFTDPKNFKSYEDLQKAIARAFPDYPHLNGEGFERAPAPRTSSVEEAFKSKTQDSFGTKAEAPKKSAKSEDWSAIDGLDDLDFDKMLG